MLFKWFDFREVRFVDQNNARMTNVHDTHDLSDYYGRLGHEMARIRESLADIEKTSGIYLSVVASHIPVPSRRLTKPLF
ncbi:MAG TPA: hypothetical protein DCR97_00125 [Deltaproteobacteria bacterium]|jgi:hypothetical protein|nr:hypothetical protein [Deltaproteobacteria bacterium]